LFLACHPRPEPFQSLILIRNRPLPPFQQEAICNQKRTKREIYQNEKKKEISSVLERTKNSVDAGFFCQGKRKKIRARKKTRNDENADNVEENEDEL